MMPSLRGSFLCAIFGATLALASVVPDAHAQAPLEDTPIPMWIPEGQVPAAVKVGNTLVVGGNFTYVGPPTGPFAIVDGADATNFNTSAGLTGVTGRVVSDGRAAGSSSSCLQKSAVSARWRTSGPTAGATRRFLLRQASPPSRT